MRRVAEIVRKPVVLRARVGREAVARVRRSVVKTRVMMIDIIEV